LPSSGNRCARMELAWVWMEASWWGASTHCVVAQGQGMVWAWVPFYGSVLSVQEWATQAQVVGKVQGRLGGCIHGVKSAGGNVLWFAASYGATGAWSLRHTKSCRHQSWTTLKLYMVLLVYLAAWVLMSGPTR
jgi:hypothetical protein